MDAGVNEFLLDTRMLCRLCLTLQPTPPPGYFADELPQALDSSAIPWLFIQILPLEAAVAVLSLLLFASLFHHLRTKGSFQTLQNPISSSPLRPHGGPVPLPHSLQKSAP